MGLFSLLLGFLLCGMLFGPLGFVGFILTAMAVFAILYVRSKHRARRWMREYEQEKEE
jgi:ABC-type nickel/cobalt efflux system permease component RcnA